MKKIKIIILFSIFLVLLPVVMADVVVRCSPSTVNTGGTVTCPVTLSTFPAISSISSARFTITLPPGNVFSIASVSNYPTGFTGDYNPSTGQVIIATGQSGLNPTSLATITLSAGPGTGAEALTLNNIRIVDNALNVVSVPSSAISNRVVVQTVAASQCGNAILDTGETCDDSNAISGDGCSSACLVEVGFTCAGTPSSCSRCGNGVVEGTEECDLGNNNGVITSTCSSSCRTWLSCTVDPTNPNSVIMQTSAGPVNFVESCNTVDNTIINALRCLSNPVSYTSTNIACNPGETCQMVGTDAVCAQATTQSCDATGTLLEDETNNYIADGTTYEITASNFLYQTYAGGIHSVEFSVNGELFTLLESNGYNLVDSGTITLTSMLYQDYAGGIHSATFCLNGRTQSCDATTAIGGSAVTIPLTCVLENLRMVLGNNVEYPTRLQKISAIARELARFI